VAERTSRPLPVSTPETAAFWAACKRRQFLYRHCLRCDRAYHFPRSICPFCWRGDVEWRTAVGRGHLYAYAIQYQPRPWIESPYVTAVVTLAAGPHVTMILEGVPPDPTQIRSGMAVELVFEDIDDEMTLYKARPIGEEGVR
jgi:uncharacterized OB-fold protein